MSAQKAMDDGRYIEEIFQYDIDQIPLHLWENSGLRIYSRKQIGDPVFSG
jgi:hypothetical protein